MSGPLKRLGAKWPVRFGSVLFVFSELECIDLKSGFSSANRAGLYSDLTGISGSSGSKTVFSGSFITSTKGSMTGFTTGFSANLLSAFGLGCGLDETIMLSSWTSKLSSLNVRPLL